MGNFHTAAQSVTKKRDGTLKNRRLSAPSSPRSVLRKECHPNHLSFACETASRICDEHESGATPPRIQVNGQDSTDEDLPKTSQPEMRISTFKKKSVPNVAKRALKCSGGAAERRLKFLASAGSLTMRSLDDGAVSDVEVTLKPLKDRARSLSPLKQLKTYTFRSATSEENFLSDQQQRSIRTSWSLVVEKLNLLNRDFGSFVFERVFSRAPTLKKAFGVEHFQSLEEVPSFHAIHRHMKLFASVIDLAVRNVDELESEIAPAVFRYGQRHYSTEIQDYFDEESVRLFCSQVICTVADLTGGEMEPICIDAWIDMMRYLGSKLLDGFRFEQLANTKKLAINANDHVFFVL